jgi:ABC-type microcin C transport system permease subunit YejB
MMLFLSALVNIDLPMLLSAIFIFSMLCLSFSLLFFFADVNMTLSALKIEMESHDKKRLIIETKGY